MYDTAVKGVEAYLLKTSRGGLKYLGEYKNGRTEAKMGHLTCFAGMVVLVFVWQFSYLRYLLPDTVMKADGIVHETILSIAKSATPVVRGD